MADPSPKILHLRTKAEAPPAFPRFSGSPNPAKLIAIAQALKGYDLVVTHGWAAINVAMAHKVFAQHLDLPPLFHQEGGGPDFEASEGRLKRKIIRRIALGSVHTLVAPVKAIGDFATKNWGVPEARIATVQPGIDLKRYRPSAMPDALPGLVKRSTESWIGAFLTPASANAPAELVHSLVDLPRDWHLVLIAGDTPSDAIRAVAETHELSNRVHLLSGAADEAKALALCDIYVECAGRYEYAPGTMKAMAAGTPVVTFGIGDITTDLERFIEDPEGRKKAGSANRDHALANFDQAASKRALNGLYEAAITP